MKADADLVSVRHYNSTHNTHLHLFSITCPTNH